MIMTLQEQQDTCSTTTNTQQQRVVMPRRVSFQQQVSVVQASPLERRRKASWYQPEDFVSFNRESVETVRALHFVQGDLSCLDPSIYCLRGLEPKIFSAVGRQRRSQKLAILRAVLCVQQEQRETGVKDPETIKSLCTMLSKLSRDRAVEMAELDAKACQQQHRCQQEESRSGKRRSLDVEITAKRRRFDPVVSLCRAAP